jgi:sugar phosphate isomerase/epimerase
MARGNDQRSRTTPAKIRKENFVYAKNAGFPLIYVDPDPARSITIERWRRDYDIKVAIHNHGPEDKRWPRPQDAYAAIKSRDKRLGLCIDIGHTTRTGTDPVQACRECRDRLYDMHVKDLASKTEKESQVEVGRGVIDFPALFGRSSRSVIRDRSGWSTRSMPRTRSPA